MFLIPIESDKPNTGYCIYVYDVSPKVDSDAMVDLSGDVASEVLKACVKLRSSNDIKKTFQEVIEDIRSLCGSEHCCILLTDPDSRTCEVLGDALSKDTKLLPMSTYLDGFYEITETWAETLGGSTCIIKRENDEKGHSAGDKMLCTAAKILQKVFRDGDVYRAGGDEFMIMIPEIAEDEVPKRIQQVHEVAKAKKIHFSIGACHGGKDIRKAMHTADERMYADKNAYYEAHPEEKYR